jgi:hypothetical protein
VRDQSPFRVKEHFTAPQWVDLVRGQLAEEVASEMDKHLRAGCGECVAAFDAWQGLAVFASEERASTAPEDAVRVAKSYLAQQKLASPAASNPLASWASATLATLVFDSQQAAPVGVRSAAAAFSRHLVYGAKSLVVDLHIDAASRSGWFLLQGQVADSSRPDQPLENVWLSLVDDRQEISTFQTNELGEFRCTFDLRRALKLMVYAGRDVVAIPIETLFDPSTDTSATH